MTKTLLMAAVPSRWAAWAASGATALALAACGGADSSAPLADTPTPTAVTPVAAAPAVPAGAPVPAVEPAATAPAPATAVAAPETIAVPAVPAAPATDASADRADDPRLQDLRATPTTQRDAVRLADQATFGATEALIASIRSQGPAAWVRSQMQASNSRYTSGLGDAVHTNVQATFHCDLPAYAGPNCWRDWFSTSPLLWDFYRNAVTQPDQLRQRVAFALQQILVVSNLEVSGTYGFRNYHNMLLDNAFGNYREVLRRVTLSPVMGDFLNNANNDKAAPNENFARELLQLFSIGTCELNADGTLRGSTCQPTYDNAMVRNYAYALTGWTYPRGGNAVWGCWPQGLNCRYYGGDMVPAAGFHDGNARPLLGGLAKPAGSTPATALATVLDSLMSHPNTAPFVGRQLIQFLVSSNPTPAYVQRVATAFTTGRFVSSGQTFGTGQRGDLAATVAAVLLDAEARGAAPASPNAGRLREPVQLMTGVLRALNGRTDGDALGWWWGEVMRQHVFRPPSVFNFYPPDYPVPGTNLVGPAFGIHNANSALERLNYLVYLLDWNGSAAPTNIPNAVGTRVNLDAFLADATDAPRLVDRLSNLAIGGPLPAAQRTQVIAAVQWWTSSTDRTNWQLNRVRTAATPGVDPMKLPATLARREFLRRTSALGAALGLGGTSLLPTLAQAQTSGYRALVCVFLYGGNDGCNTIVPTDSERHTAYSGVRAGLAIPRSALVPLPGIEFGLHPALSALAPVWAEGRLAPVFNVGPLFAPLTKAQYRAASASSDLIPDNLFSHSDQQTLWETATTNAMERTGWGGRTAQTMALANPVISVGGNGRFGLSSTATPLVLPEPGQTFGAHMLQPQDTWTPYMLRKQAIESLYAQSPDLLLAGAYQAQQRDAFSISARLGALVRRQPGEAGGNAVLDAAFAPIMTNGRINTPLGRQLYQIAKLIDGRSTVQGNRQVFFAQLGGFDTHGNQVAQSATDGEHARLLKTLGDALACFHNALKAIAMADAVTTFTQSDFGRTFKPNNSAGTDHAWGNHHLVLGGAVRGARTYGTYPTLALGGPDDVGVQNWELQGRWIPTTSVDQYAATLLSWFGMPAAQLDAVLPNLRNFGSNRNVGFV
jgi:uncharacterized protein (DUF1501 family)/uncharacterized protein (DUF1800 family)